MKRTYLTSAEARVKDFHTHGEQFKEFIEETIHQLEEVIRTAQDEVNLFKRLRDAVNLTIGNESTNKPRLAPSMPQAKSLESELGAELDTDLERELKGLSTPKLTEKAPPPKQN